MGQDGLELALRHRAQEPGRDADVARLGAQAGGVGVRRRVVDDANLGSLRETRGNRDVVHEAAERPDRLRIDLVRVGQARDDASMAEESEHAVDRGADQRNDAERQVEDRADEAGEEEEEEDEPDNDDSAAEAVAPNLLLEGHVAGVSETCGGAMSPSAEKNSFSPNPSGRATRTQGMLWIAVL